MLLLQDSTLEAVQNMQISSVLAEGILQTIIEAKEHFGPLQELFESLPMISTALQTVFSRNAAILLAAVVFLMMSVISISCCFGLRWGYYLTVGYCEWMGPCARMQIHR